MTGRRKTKSVEDIVWMGKVYRRHPDHPNRSMRCYYMCTTYPRSYLHRDKYEATHGPIPDGWHVHHSDHDTLNNSIENLILLSSEDHAILHWKRLRLVDAQCHNCGVVFKATFDRAKWCSPSCKEGARRAAGTAYIRPRKGPFIEERECNNCGAGYLAKRPWARFCSARCKTVFAKGKNQ